MLNFRNKPGCAWRFAAALALLAILACGPSQMSGGAESGPAAADTTVVIPPTPAVIMPAATAAATPVATAAVPAATAAATPVATAAMPAATAAATPVATAAMPAGIAAATPLATAGPVVAATAAPTAAPLPKDGVRNVDRAEAEQARRKFEGLLRASWATDFTRASISFEEIMTGGPPKDGIPAIDAPEFESVADADAWLDDREPVQAVDINGDRRAYPVQVLVWHELVNDTVGGDPVVITF